jgi:hypothetical protein
VVNEPDLNKLREVLEKYGGSDLRVPYYSIHHIPAYDVSVSVSMTWDGTRENTPPNDARECKRWYLDRVDALQDELESVGWIAHGRICVELKSHKSHSAFTPNRKLYTRGVELPVECMVELNLAWFDGEVQ